ncbi:hypothetical protein V8E55_007714 [Tylopilus felleus]
MCAVVYEGPSAVSVKEVAKPVHHPSGRLTTTCICGSDWHMYEGRTAAQGGIVFGHEKFFRYVAMGLYQGGQAEYVKVPFANFNALKLPGESVAVFGVGPVGLMAAYSAIVRGASEVYVVDRVPEKLQKAKEIGCVPIDISKGDPVELIKALRGGQVFPSGEVDRGVDAVGYQATTGDGKTEKLNAVLEALINVVRPTGGLGIPGLYVPSDPGAPMKWLRIGTGQCNVKAYNRYLRDLIISGKAKPSFVVSHHMSLDGASTAYDKFDKRVDGFTKALLHP